MDAGLNATTILVRRIKQGAAEWCRFQVKERAWNGFREHTMDGYDIGTRPTATPPAASHTPPPPGQPRPAPRPGSPPIPNGLGIITPNCPSLFDWSPARLAGCTQKWHLLITCAANPLSGGRGPGFRPGRRHRLRARWIRLLAAVVFAAAGVSAGATPFRPAPSARADEVTISGNDLRDGWDSAETTGSLTPATL